MRTPTAWTDAIDGLHRITITVDWNPGNRSWPTAGAYQSRKHAEYIAELINAEFRRAEQTKKRDLEQPEIEEICTRLSRAPYHEI